MNIIEHLQESVERTTGLNMHYQSLEGLNEILDGVEYPCAYSFLLESAGLVRDNNRYKERISLAVCFTDLTEYDFNSLENEDVLQRCKEYACKFLLGMNNDPYFTLLSVNGSERVYEKRFDVIVTGYAVNVTIEEQIGLSECNLQI